ncbi:MAG: class D sortase [Acidobacteria bacterium]|nr:MAG: class D sortase [Acidobacteriota bacterium]
MHPALALLRRALTVVGVVCLGGWATVKGYAFVATARNEAILARLTAARRDGLERPERFTAGRPPAEAALLGRIDIPSVDVSAVVLQGTSERCLEQAAGHVDSTALPGGGGNVAIAGHRDSVFRRLEGIRLGDAIKVSTPDATQLYRVDAIRIVDPSDTAVLAPSRSPRLTLITCYPFHYIGPAPHRVVVQARAAGPDGAAAYLAQAAAPARPAPLSAPVTTAHQAVSRRPVRRHAAPHGAERAGPPPVPAPRPRVSWLRRLFHLGPKPTARR